MLHCCIVQVYCQLFCLSGKEKNNGIVRLHQNHSDAWFIAYTPDLVIGTWVGASTPDVHFYSSYGSGSSLALPIVANVINEIEKDLEMKRKYLTSFGLPNDLYSFLQCAPFHQTGIRGFFSRLFGQKDKKDSDTLVFDDKEKSKKGKKIIFQKVVWWG